MHADRVVVVTNWLVVALEAELSSAVAGIASVAEGETFSLCEE